MFLLRGQRDCRLGCHNLFPNMEKHNAHWDSHLTCSVWTDGRETDSDICLRKLVSFTLILNQLLVCKADTEQTFIWLYSTSSEDCAFFPWTLKMLTYRNSQIFPFMWFYSQPWVSCKEKPSVFSFNGLYKAVHGSQSGL